MPITVTMPRLSDTMEVGTVVQWHVKEGDTVSPGDVLADIETDKATMELEAFDEGTIAKLAAKQGDAVNVGDPIVIIAEEGEDVSEAAKGGGEAKAESKDKSESKAESTSESKSETKQAEGSNAPSSSTGTATASAPTSNGSANGSATRSGDGGRIFASPLAKKIAGEHNVDLSGIDGTGPSGRIVKKDVEQALERGSSAPVARSAPSAPELPPLGASLQDNTVALSNMRGTIAKRLVESKQSIPHYQVTVEVDMDALLDLREQLNEQLSAQGVKLTVNDFLVRACALAMHQHPFVNSSWDGSGSGSGNPPSIRQHGEVNIGVAVALPEERGGGLVVPVLKNTDRMGLRTISGETRRLAKKAREKGLSVEDMEGSTFTISNLGMFGVAHFTAIINPPNACILAVGAAREIPVVRDGQLMIGSVMSMTMSSDHRIVDGAMAAQYLNTVKGMLEAPATLLV